MQCDVVEGEPGIFPEPVTRIMRAIGGLFGGRGNRTDESPPAAGETTNDAALAEAPDGDGERGP